MGNYHWFEATLFNSKLKYRTSCLVMATSTREIASYFDLDCDEMLMINPMSKAEVKDRLTKSGQINKMDNKSINELNDDKHYIK